MPGIGAYIGEISYVVLACADDLVVLTGRKDVLKSLVNIAVDHCYLEHYLLQKRNHIITSTTN